MRISWFLMSFGMELAHYSQSKRNFFKNNYYKSLLSTLNSIYKLNVIHSREIPLIIKSNTKNSK